MIKDEIRARVLRRALTQPLTLRLFTAIDDRTGITELKEGGYAPVDLTLADWTFDGGMAIADVKTFRFNGSKRFTVLGAVLTEADGGVVWMREFKEPISVGRNGDVIPVRPTAKIDTLM
jgi:hypothetical protein